MSSRRNSGARPGSTDHHYDYVEVGVAIAPAFRRLPECEQQIIQLRFFEDLTQSEIAAAAALRLLATLARSVRRIGDLRRALLAHALLAQTLVLLVVLDARPVLAARLLGRTNRGKSGFEGAPVRRIARFVGPVRPHQAVATERPTDQQLTSSPDPPARLTEQTQSTGGLSHPSRASDATHPLSGSQAPA